MRREDISHYAKFPKLRLDEAEYLSAVQLGEYSATIPSGVTPGKRWRRLDGVYDQTFLAEGGVPIWLIGEYGPEKDGRCAILYYRPLVRIRAPSTVMVVITKTMNQDVGAQLTSDWCLSELGYRPTEVCFGYGQLAYKFRREADAMAFKLRFG